MKKLLFFAVFALLASTSFAQGNINKGDWMVGGDASFNYEKQGDYKTTNIGFMPNVGYFFINNFAGGLRINVSSSKNEFLTQESTSSGFNIGPFVRYYFLPSSQKVNLFADAGFGFGQIKSSSGSFDSKSTFTQFGIKAGPAIFLTPSSALEIALGYNSNKYENVSDRENGFGIHIGFQIHLGGSAKK